MTESVTQDPQVLIIGSTNTVRLIDFEDTDTGTPPADWTVTVTAVLDSTGASIAGTTNLAMAYTAAAPGFPACYKGVIPSTASLVAGACTIRVTATSSGGTKIRRFDIPGTIQTI